MIYEKFPVPGRWLVPDHCKLLLVLLFSQFSSSVMSDSLRPHGLQHARLPCPSPTPVASSNSYNHLNALAHLRWNVSKSQQSAAEAARKGRGHLGSWTSVPSENKGNPRWERGHRGGGMACGVGMTPWLKDAYLSSTRLHSINFLWPILSKPLSSTHFLKILTENIIYAHCFLQNAIQLGISLSYPKPSIPPSSHLRHSHQEPVSFMVLQAYSRHIPV